MLHQREDFQRKHRQHARHQVQDHPPDKRRAEDRDEQRLGGRGRRDRIAGRDGRAVAGNGGGRVRGDGEFRNVNRLRVSAQRLIGNQDAAELVRLFAVLLKLDRERKFIGIGARDGFRGIGVAQDVALLREKLDRFERLARQRRSALEFDLERILVVIGGSLQGGVRHRQPRPRQVEEILVVHRKAQVEHPRIERQGQLGLAGNALLLADEPARFGLEVEMLWEIRFRRRDRGQQVNIAAVAVGDQRSHVMFFRRRPLDGAGGEAGRHRPLDRGGHPGVARIDPVGVPARIRVEMQRDIEGFAQLDRGHFGNQFRGDVRLRNARAGPVRGGVDGIGGANGENSGQEQEQNNPGHHGSIE